MARSPEFNQAILDRTDANIERDKNRPSVVIWSLGNERVMVRILSKRPLG